MKTFLKMLPVMCLMSMFALPVANAQQMQKKEMKKEMIKDSTMYKDMMKKDEKMKSDKMMKDEKMSKDKMMDKKDMMKDKMMKKDTTMMKDKKDGMK